MTQIINKNLAPNRAGWCDLTMTEALLFGAALAAASGLAVWIIDLMAGLIAGVW